MRHKSTQVVFCLVLHARARRVRLCVADEVPLGSVLVVPVVAHLCGLLRHKCSLSVGFLPGEGGSVVARVVAGPQPVKRDWGRDESGGKSPGYSASSDLVKSIPGKEFRCHHWLLILRADWSQLQVADLKDRIWRG